MLGLFKRKEDPIQTQAAAIYNLAVEQAREPSFYTEGHIPDSIDGRFELISLHVILIILSLEKHKEQNAQYLSQALFDEMFLDMDRSLREMGVGDLSVPKKMKAMMNGFNGRAQAYRQALIDETESLEDVVRRNIFGTVDEIDVDSVSRMVRYIEAQMNSLDKLALDSFLTAERFFEQNTPFYEED